MAPIWWSWPKGRICDQPTKDWVCAPRWNLRGQNCAKSQLFKKRLWKTLLHTHKFLCSNLDTKYLQMFSYHNTIFAKLLRLLVHSMSVPGQHVDLCWWEVCPSNFYFCSLLHQLPAICWAADAGRVTELQPVPAPKGFACLATCRRVEHIYIQWYNDAVRHSWDSRVLGHTGR